MNFANAFILTINQYFLYTISLQILTGIQFIPISNRSQKRIRASLTTLPANETSATLDVPKVMIRVHFSFDWREQNYDRISNYRSTVLFLTVVFP